MTTSVHLNFADPAINQDPFEVLAELRNMAPAVYNTATDSWLVTRYKDVRTVLGRGETFEQDGAFTVRMLGGDQLSSLNGDLHKAVRSVYAYEFRRGTLERWAAMVRDIVRDLVDPAVERLRSGEVVDVVENVIRQIPVRVILGMLGLPADFRETFREWAEGLVGVLGASIEADPVRSAALYARGEAARDAVTEYCGELLASRRLTPGPTDLVRLLAESSVDVPPACGRSAAGKTHMTEGDMRAQVALLVVAALDNAASAMATMMVVLAQHPSQRQAINEDRSLLPQAIDEILRYEGPVMAIPRAAHGDGELDGVTIPAGDKVWGMIGSANRDPERWDAADRFDVFRERKGSLAFGVGPHNCLGINLGRMEIHLLLEHLLDAIPEWEMATDDLDYGHNFIVRGPQSVPIRL